MARDLIATLAMLATIAMAWPAAAQALAQEGSAALPDPTRPPAVMGGAQGPSGATASRIPMLQSVFISRERQWAIIGGERIDLGAKFGDARLVRLDESEAILEGPQGRTTLRLVPDVKITTTGAAPGAAEESRTQSKKTRNNPP